MFLYNSIKIKLMKRFSEIIINQFLLKNFGFEKRSYSKKYRYKLYLTGYNFFSFFKDKTLFISDGLILKNTGKKLFNFDLKKKNNILKIFKKILILLINPLILNKEKAKFLNMLIKILLRRKRKKDFRQLFFIIKFLFKEKYFIIKKKIIEILKMFEYDFSFSILITYLQFGLKISQCEIKLKKLSFYIIFLIFYTKRFLFLVSFFKTFFKKKNIFFVKIFITKIIKKLIKNSTKMYFFPLKEIIQIMAKCLKNSKKKNFSLEVFIFSHIIKICFKKKHDDIFFLIPYLFIEIKRNSTKIQHRFNDILGYFFFFLKKDFPIYYFKKVFNHIFFF